MSTTAKLVGHGPPPSWAHKWVERVEVYDVTRRRLFRSETLRVWGYEAWWYVVATGEDAPYWTKDAIWKMRERLGEERAIRRRLEWGRKLQEKGAA